MPSQTPLRCTINDLPPQVLEQVFRYFCAHCVRPSVIETAAEKQVTKIWRRTLSNACCVSRAVGPVAKQVLFHMYTTTT